MSPADVGLLLVYGGVVAYFASRFLRFRMWPSLGVALLPSGWIVVALLREPPEPLKWCGIALGAALLVLVLHADRGDKK